MKEKTSANQLAQMIRSAIGVAEVFVQIRRDHAYGWQPRVEASGINTVSFQRGRRLGEASKITVRSR
jgi:hypothetical protein